MVKTAWAAALVVLWALGALAAPVPIILDETVSAINVELCIEGECDDDTSRVGGSIDIELDDYTTPITITLYDFELILLDDIDLRIGIPFGALDVTGRDIVTRYAMPGTPHPPAPLVAGAFAFASVPSEMEGSMSYSATGTMCALFTAAGLPCDNAIDLADLGTQNIDSVTGEVSIAGDTITLTFEPNLTVPLDPTNPSFGELSLTGQVIGYGTVPSCPDPPGPVALLRATRSVDEVALSWELEPLSTNGYRVYSVTDKLHLPPNGADPDATLECETASVTETDCPDPDGLASPPTLLLYQAVGVCSDGTTEGAN